MNFRKAWKAMLEGKKVRRPFWAGYWAWECGTIMIHERDGSVLDIRSTNHVAYTFDNIASKDWEIVKEEEEEKTQLPEEKATFPEENATSNENPRLISLHAEVDLIMPCMPARRPHDTDIWEQFWKEKDLFHKDAPEDPGQKDAGEAAK